MKCDTDTVKHAAEGSHVINVLHCCPGFWQCTDQFVLPQVAGKTIQIQQKISKFEQLLIMVDIVHW